MDKVNMNELVKLAVDGYKGNVEKFSVKQAEDALREALIEANGGKTTLDYKALRRGQGTEVFDWGCLLKIDDPDADYTRVVFVDLNATDDPEQILRDVGL